MTIYGMKIVPVENKGLEDYIFTQAFPDVIYVYHNVEYKSPRGRNVTGWMCCTEGWKKTADGKWHEKSVWGFKPGRVADGIDDIFEYYRE